MMLYIHQPRQSWYRVLVEDGRYVHVSNAEHLRTAPKVISNAYKYLSLDPKIAVGFNEVQNACETKEYFSTADLTFKFDSTE